MNTSDLTYRTADESCSALFDLVEDKRRTFFTNKRNTYLFVVNTEEGEDLLPASVTALLYFASGIHLHLSP